MFWNTPRPMQRAWRPLSAGPYYPARGGDGADETRPGLWLCRREYRGGSGAPDFMPFGGHRGTRNLKGPRPFGTPNPESRAIRLQRDNVTSAAFSRECQPPANGITYANGDTKDLARSARAGRSSPRAAPRIFTNFYSARIAPGGNIAMAGWIGDKSRDKYKDKQETTTNER